MDTRTDESVLELEQRLERALAELAAEKAGRERLKAEYDELARSEDRFRMMFENVPLGYMSMDENARLIDVNAAFANFFGYTYDEIVGKRFADLLADGIEYHLTETFPAFKRLGYSKDTIWNVRKKDGSVATILMNGRVRYDNNGKFIQTHCMMLDITETRKAKEALAKSEKEKALILDAISERVVYHDPDGGILWANRVVHAYDPGVPCWVSWRGRDAPCEGCPTAEALRVREPRSGEIAVDGKAIQISAHPIQDEAGAFLGIVQIASDVTERRRLERELADAGETERERIGRDLHDGLGQQLTGISFLARALAKESVQPEAADTAERISEAAGTALKSMRSILRGLCPVSEGPRGLARALEVLASETETFADARCVFSSGDFDIADRRVASHLFYIAREAVCNAAKHSGCAEIELRLTREGDRGRLEIQDDGRGIPEAPDSSRGMGLRTMRWRASLIDATLDLRPGLHGGTTVACVFPLSGSD